jgi:hypothetical protein
MAYRQNTPGCTERRRTNNPFRMNGYRDKFTLLENHLLGNEK